MNARAYASKLREIAAKIENYPKHQSVPVVDIFNDSFMQRNSKFSDFQSFMVASGVQFNDEGRTSPEFETFVIENTRFSSYEEMKKVAATEFVKKGLGL